MSQAADLFQKEIHGVAASRFRPSQGLFQLRHRKAPLYADQLKPEHCQVHGMTQSQADTAIYSIEIHKSLTFLVVFHKFSWN